jgi:hypothetical protein
MLEPPVEDDDAAYRKARLNLLESEPSLTLEAIDGCDGLVALDPGG